MRSWVALLTALSAAPLLAGASPSEEAWFGIHFHGQKVGHVRAHDRESKLSGADAVHVERWSLITVRRRDEEIRMEHRLDAWFSPDGTPLRYKIHRQEGAETRDGEGWRDGDRFFVRQTIGGRAKTREYPIEGLRLASSLEWLHLRDPKAGAVVRGQALDESEGDVQPFSLEVGPLEGGRHTVKEKMGGIESRLVVEPKVGVVESELLGAGITVRRTSRAEAVRLDATVDIFSAAMFPVKAVLPERAGIETLTVVFSSETRPVPKVPSFPRQAVRATSDGRVEVEITAPGTPRRGAKLPLRGAKLAPYLGATDYEDLEDERLVAAAQKAVAGATDAWTAARRLNRFVHLHLEEKSLARAFASATEAFVEKAGDCTEHSVLFSALAKIVGLPTKLVTGLVYVGGARPAFGYHEWVEVWLGDRWHPMDPTFGQDVADATHIKFSEGLSDPAGLREAGLAAASLIGDLELTVVGWEPNGKR